MQNKASGSCIDADMSEESEIYRLVIKPKEAVIGAFSVAFTSPNKLEAIAIAASWADAIHVPESSTISLKLPDGDETDLTNLLRRSG